MDRSSYVSISSVKIYALTTKTRQKLILTKSSGQSQRHWPEKPTGGDGTDPFSPIGITKNKQTNKLSKQNDKTRQSEYISK